MRPAPSTSVGTSVPRRRQRRRHAAKESADVLGGRRGVEWVLLPAIVIAELSWLALLVYLSARVL